MWLMNPDAQVSVSSIWLRLDLGTNFDLSYMKIWNYNVPNKTSCGVKNIRASFHDTSTCVVSCAEYSPEERQKCLSMCLEDLENVENSRNLFNATFYSNSRMDIEVMEASGVLDYAPT